MTAFLDHAAPNRGSTHNRFWTARGGCLLQTDGKPRKGSSTPRHQPGARVGWNSNIQLLSANESDTRLMVANSCRRTGRNSLHKMPQAAVRRRSSTRLHAIRYARGARQNHSRGGRDVSRAVKTVHMSTLGRCTQLVRTAPSQRMPVTQVVAWPRLTPRVCNTDAIS